MTTIDTSKAEHRTLRFESIDELRAEIDHIIAAENAGTLKRTGNWTTGQIFGHIAAWMTYPYDGFPAEAKPPWFVRVIARMMRKSFTTKPMRRGFHIPKINDGTFGVDDMSTDEGARRLRDAINRLERRDPVNYHSPVFGPMSDEDRIAGNLRHAECHLGFLWP